MCLCMSTRITVILFARKLYLHIAYAGNGIISRLTAVVYVKMMIHLFVWIIAS